MDAQPSPETPATKILTVVKLHAVLATVLLVTTSSSSSSIISTVVPDTTAATTAVPFHPIQQHHHNSFSFSANVLSYLHLWCATLGFAWWYAVQSDSQGAKVKQGWVEAG